LRLDFFEFGEEGRRAGDGVTRVFGELHLLHEGFLRLGAPVGQYGLRGRGGVQTGSSTGRILRTRSPRRLRGTSQLQASSGACCRLLS
jgi:hypothetical protein